MAINPDESEKENEIPARLRKRKDIKNVDLNERLEDEKDIYNLDEGLFTAIKKEHKILRAPFTYALKKDKQSFPVVVLTEIFDKIYFTKTFFLFRKFDIFPIMISLYILYHILVLVLSTMFTDIKKIETIYLDENFPNKKHFIIYGFIIFVITWILYLGFLLLVRFDVQINALVVERNNIFIKEGKEYEEVRNKYQKLMKQIRIRLNIYYAIMIVLSIFSFLYINGFFAVYTGTRKWVFILYGVSLVICAAIKTAYGLILGIFRFAGVRGKGRVIYDAVKFCDTYIC